MTGIITWLICWVAKGESVQNYFDHEFKCHLRAVKSFFTLSPCVALHRLPVFCVGETELRDDPQLILRLPHELEAPLQLQQNKSSDAVILYYYILHIHPYSTGKCFHATLLTLITLFYRILSARLGISHIFWIICDFCWSGVKDVEFYEAKK